MKKKVKLVLKALQFMQQFPTFKNLKEWDCLDGLLHKLPSVSSHVTNPDCALNTFSSTLLSAATIFIKGNIGLATVAFVEMCFF